MIKNPLSRNTRNALCMKDSSSWMLGSTSWVDSTRSCPLKVHEFQVNTIRRIGNNMVKRTIRNIIQYFKGVS